MVHRMYGQFAPLAGGALRLYIEFPHRDDLLVVELEADRMPLRHLEEIEYPTPQRKLPLLLDDAVSLVTEPGEDLGEFERIPREADPEAHQQPPVLAGIEDLLEHRPRGANEHPAGSRRERLERRHLQTGQVPVRIVIVVGKHLVLGVGHDPPEPEYGGIIDDIPYPDRVGGDDEHGRPELLGEVREHERASAPMEPGDIDLRRSPGEGSHDGRILIERAHPFLQIIPHPLLLRISSALPPIRRRIAESRRGRNEA